MLIFGQLSLMFITEKTEMQKEIFKIKVRIIIIIKQFVKYIAFYFKMYLLKSNECLF